MFSVRILSPEEMRAADEATFKAIGIPSRAVMESAGRAVAMRIVERWLPENKPVVVLAGGGNNGGDGFVVARALFGLGVRVSVLSTVLPEKLSGDCLQNCESLIASGAEVETLDPECWEQKLNQKILSSCALVVDAIYGTGFRGPIRGYISQVIEHINSLGVPIVSIDIPSGVEASTGVVGETAIRASETIALQALKPGHLLHPGVEYCGVISCVDIGVSSELGMSKPDGFLISFDAVGEILRQTLYFSPEMHKNTKGHVLVVGGSPGHFGAPQLSGQAALRTVSGLVTLVLPKQAADLVAPNLKELMAASLPSDSTGNFSGELEESLELILTNKQAMVIGPGMGVGLGSLKVLSHLLDLAKTSQIPTVLDADALTLLSQEYFQKLELGDNFILTPHPGEMSRLTGNSVSQIQRNRFEQAARLSCRLRCWVVLKGARTVVAGPDGQSYVSPIATVALATAGSGDVLAGIIASLLGCGMNSNQAVVSGVMVHGLAAELFAQKLGGRWGIIASDISSMVSLAINSLLKLEPPRARFSRLVLGDLPQLLPEIFTDIATENIEQGKVDNRKV